MKNNKKNKLSFLANLDVIIASVILALLIVLTFMGGSLAIYISCTIYLVRRSADILYGMDYICSRRSSISYR